MNKQMGGALIGGGLGGLGGSQIGKGKGRTAATIIGTLAGAFIGSSIGESLDHADQLYAERALNYSLDSGQPSRWVNSESGRSGTVVPQQPYYNNNGRQCLPYTFTVVQPNGERYAGNGNACKQ
ncbi:glycine zipper 2TM domain-containing protein [Patescibacteria group bacterium]|nr:glycine zipper 2TM domain-containing protein [Patescibacteria group bacterium]